MHYANVKLAILAHLIETAMVELRFKESDVGARLAYCQVLVWIDKLKANETKVLGDI